MGVIRDNHIFRYFNFKPLEDVSGIDLTRPIPGFRARYMGLVRIIDDLHRRAVWRYAKPKIDRAIDWLESRGISASWLLAMTICSSLFFAKTWGIFHTAQHGQDASGICGISTWITNGALRSLTFDGKGIKISGGLDW